jgi:thioredoxin reductase
MFDVLIIGGGVSGISCALVLGSAKIKILQPIKRLAFSQKSSSLQEAVLIMPTELQDHGLRFVSAKHQTLIPTLP